MENILHIFISSDSPRRFVLLHWVSFLTSLCGVVFLLLARGHYTIDVILAYYVTTRLWWSYHTLAHNNTLRTSGDHNLIANECWWYPFRWATMVCRRNWFWSWIVAGGLSAKRKGLFQEDTMSRYQKLSRGFLWRKSTDCVEITPCPEKESVHNNK